MEVEVIKDTIPGLYFDLKPKPTIILFLAKNVVFLWFGLLKPNYLD